MTQSNHAEPWPTPASNYFSIGSCQRDDPRQVRKTVQYGMEPTSNPDECSSRINVKLGRSGNALAAAAFEVVPALLWKGSFVAKLIGLHLPLLEESVLWVGVIIPTVGSCQRDAPDKCERQSNIWRPRKELASNPDECCPQINVKLARKSENSLGAATFEVVPALLWRGSFVAKLIGLHLPLLEESVLWVGVIIPTLGRGTNGGWLNVSYLLDVV
ncbi:hypothetical protein CEXT_331141 [Caerostris extrusa]|uniref:Uncharacterized protein n=1 Tax=Caerostris extrusa TaxID=172846 RepID=A0AAV4QK81_CAEEX|nr:hypothetical protein CEXT_331141 [Caerostris extrusa]